MVQPALPAEGPAAMADTARTIDIVTPEGYLARERESSHRHEFVNGVIYAMSGTSDRHNRIAGNLYSALNAHLPDRCVPYMSDMKLRIRLERTEFFYYPDSMVCCGATDQSADWRDNPLTVGEVLSPSTERVDRAEKHEAYMQIPSLQEYILIEQAMPRIELFRRSNQWQREILLAGDTLHLPSIDFTIAIDALYRRAEF
jgi:Uma2 family endonuclease